MDLWNIVGILPQHYTASQHRRHQLILTTCYRNRCAVGFLIHIRLYTFRIIFSCHLVGLCCCFFVKLFMFSCLVSRSFMFDTYIYFDRNAFRVVIVTYSAFQNCKIFLWTVIHVTGVEIAYWNWRIKLKMEVKLSLYLTKHHTMTTYWGSGGIAPCILDLVTRWRWVVSPIAPAALPPGKHAPLPIG
jgi:hypothetical protein